MRGKLRNLGNRLKAGDGAGGGVPMIAPSERPTARAMGYRAPLMAGVATLLVFFGGFGTWAALAPLESAAVAAGNVVVGGNRRTVQHLEGGIVSQILVEEGDRVEEGQTLIMLDETQPRAALGLLHGQLRAAVAREARLIAEREGTDEIRYPDWLMAETSHPRIAEIVSGQTNIFHSRRDTIESQTDILQKRIDQYHEEIAGLRGEIQAQSRQLDLIREEEGDVRTLVNKGLERKSRLLALQRQMADIEGERARARSMIARAEQAIAEAELRMIDLRTNMRTEVVTELREVQTEIADVWERIGAAEDVLNRTAIRAPVSGVVVGQHVFTTGGVIAPGDPLMDIVPQNEELIIEARVAPVDIDVVTAGQPAQVRLTAYATRNTPVLNGRVQVVSADRLLDERSGAAYYSARIRLDPNEMDRIDGGELYPGMPAEVMIVAGERTPLDYLMKPLINSFNRAMREN